MLDLTLDMPDERRLVARFSEFDAALQRRLKGPIDELTAKMWAAAEAAEPMRTGELRADTREFVDKGEGYIRGKVKVLGHGGRGHNVKAAALEYGAHGNARVAAHEMMLGHLWGVALEPRAVLIGEYMRRVHIGEVAYLRHALAEVHEMALAAVETAVGEETAAFNEL